MTSKGLKCMLTSNAADRNFFCMGYTTIFVVLCIKSLNYWIYKLLNSVSLDISHLKFNVYFFSATTLPSGCGPDKFLCNNSRCIPSLFLCDLDNDCGDNSDEHSNCTQATCPPDQFTCHNQQECILAEWKCDGDNDCGDKSDELNCCKLNLCYFPIALTLFGDVVKPVS